MQMEIYSSFDDKQRSQKELDSDEKLYAITLKVDKFKAVDICVRGTDIYNAIDRLERRLQILLGDGD